MRLLLLSLLLAVAGMSTAWADPRSFHAGIARIKVQDTTPFDAVIVYPTEAAEVDAPVAPVRASLSSCFTRRRQRPRDTAGSSRSSASPRAARVHRHRAVPSRKRAAFRRSAATRSQGARCCVGRSTLCQTRRSRPDRHGGVLFRRRGDFRSSRARRSIWRTCRPIAVIIPTISEPAEASPLTAPGLRCRQARNRTMRCL